MIQLRLTSYRNNDSQKTLKWDIQNAEQVWGNTYQLIILYSAQNYSSEMKAKIRIFSDK